MGHHIDDDLLMEVTRRLQKVFRPEDTISRFGGDEFLILVEDIDRDKTEEIIQRVLRSFHSLFMLDGREITVSVSVGISIYPEDAEDPDNLIKHADLAMYKAKSSVRNSYEFYSAELSEIMKERFELEHDFRKTFDNREFEVYYQPQVSLSSMTVKGVEALIRWKHPERGWVSPAVFIPVAEETGLIHDIGLYVFEECCAQIAKWAESDLKKIRIAINISIKQFANAHLADTLKEIVSRHGVSPSLIELEITESHMMENQIEIIPQLNALREIGFYLAIDDFGTGYSSLNILKNLPIHRLKIDQSFIRDVTYDVNDRTIALTIIAMGKNLGLNLIAEGVEIEEQLDFLIRNGCDEAQSYLFSKPTDVKQFELWYREFVKKKNR